MVVVYRFKRWAVFVHRPAGWAIEETYDACDYDLAVTTAQRILRRRGIDRVGVQDMNHPGKPFTFADFAQPRKAVIA